MTNTMTITYCGLELEIEFDYQPAEKAVMYYSDGSGYPGCSESLEINKVMIGSHDITELCERHKLFNDLEQKMYDERSEDNR